MRRIAAFLFAVLAAFPAVAEDVYPSHPITLITPYAPGGASDFLTRTLGRRAADAAQPDGARAEHRRRRRRGRLDAGGQGQARRLHAADQPHRHVDHSAALQEAQFRSPGVLRVHRPVRRGAHGDPGAQRLCAQDFRRAGGLCQGQQGEAHHGLGGHGQRHASLRHAVPGGDRRAAHHGAVQGRRTGRDRPARAARST